MRFVAALGVVLLHFRVHVAHLFPGIKALEPVLSAGNMGVDLFFILSGFILTYNYVDWFPRVRPAHYFRFLALRLARIYPLHVFTLALLALGLVAAHARGIAVNSASDYSLQDLWRNLLLVHAWTRDGRVSWNYPSWSISAEWFAYLLFPFFTVVVGRVRRPASLMAGAAAALVLQYVLFDITGLDGSALLRIGGEFAAGCFLGRLYLEGWGERFRWSVAAWGCVAALLALCFVIPAGPQRRYLVPVFAVLIFSLARSENGLSRLLSTRFCVFWGEASYAMYLTHGLIEVIGAKALPMQSFAAASLGVKLGVVALYAAAIPAAAAAAYLLVEQPSRRWLRRLIDRCPMMGIA